MSNEENGQKHGSNPCRTANFAQQNEDFSKSATVRAQNRDESGSRKVKFAKNHPASKNRSHDLRQERQLPRCKFGRYSKLLSR